MIKELEDYVESECKKANEMRQYIYHINPVRKYALLLAKKYKANKKIVEAAALLHDIARVKFGGHNHEIKGAKEAVKVLRKLNCPEDFIEKVRHCILAHRHSKNIKPKTIEAKIIKTADALVHFDTVPLLISAAYEKIGLRGKDAWAWVYDKIQRDWKSGLLPEGKKLVKKKYEAIKLLFKDLVKK